MVAAGQMFESTDEEARQLIALGLARTPDPPRVVYETKIITPEAPQVAARDPFQFIPVGHVPVPDHADPPALAAVRDRVLADADVPPERTADSQRKRGRPRKHSS